METSKLTPYLQKMKDDATTMWSVFVRDGEKVYIQHLSGTGVFIHREIKTVDDIIKSGWSDFREYSEKEINLPIVLGPSIPAEIDSHDHPPKLDQSDSAPSKVQSGGPPLPSPGD
jgi:hypothetical protein